LHVQAAAKSAAHINNVQVWVDGVKRYQVAGGTLDSFVSVPAGNRRLSIVAVDSNGVTYKQTIYVNAQ
jgi:hypothetical protein